MLLRNNETGFPAFTPIDRFFNRLHRPSTRSIRPHDAPQPKLTTSMITCDVLRLILQDNVSGNNALKTLTKLAQNDAAELKRLQSKEIELRQCLTAITLYRDLQVQLSDSDDKYGAILVKKENDLGELIRQIFGPYG